MKLDRAEILVYLVIQYLSSHKFMDFGILIAINANDLQALVIKVKDYSKQMGLKLNIKQINNENK